MKKLFLIFFAVVALLGGVHQQASAADVTFAPTTAEVPNQGRGFYAWGGSFYFDSFDSGSLSAAYTAGDRLTIGLMNLAPYINTATLPDALFTNWTAKAALLRSSGMKVILRPVYNYDNNGADATLSITLGHVAQMAQWMSENADVIAFRQGGYFGPFGENWQGASSLARSTSDKHQLYAAIRAGTHPYTYIQARYPRDVTAMPGMSSALTAASAFTGSAQSQLGHHNDCIGAGPGDSGTYLVQNTTLAGNPERARVAADSTYTPWGGEGCTGVGTPTRQPCVQVMAEFPLYHATYINRSYPAAWITQWQTEGCYAELRRSLGYRIQLDRLTHPDTASINTPVKFNVYARNTGWGPMLEVRTPQIRLVHTVDPTKVYAQKGYSDLRLEMKPGNSFSSKMPVTISVPTAGTYSVHICFPSPWPTQGTMSSTFIATDTRYSIQPANATSGGQSYNAGTGCFVTGTNITFS